MDPWKEATQCYEEFADELIITGMNGRRSLAEDWRKFSRRF